MFYEYNDKDLCKKLLPMINKNRLIDNRQCLLIGNIIFNIFPKDEGLELWYSYCEGDKSEYEKKYSLFNKSECTVKTLAYYARKDSPELYEKFQLEYMRGIY
jgi:hypothetical protein